MRLICCISVLSVCGALLAQDNLSPVTMDNVKLGADYDGRKELCRVLIKATASNGLHRVVRCTNQAVVLAAGDADACAFTQQRSGAVLYVDESIAIRKGSRPVSTANLQTRLETFSVNSVGGLLQAFGFESISQQGNPTVELHYNACLTR